MNEKVLEKNIFVFNDKDNGGEQLSVVTEFIANGDVNGVFVNQEITLQSYCNSASFNLYGISMTPEALRNLANQLESCMVNAKAKTRME